MSLSLRWMRALSLAALAWPAMASAQVQSTPEDAAKIEFFEKKVRPILVNNCYTCHSANTNARGGLRVDDRNGLLHGGNLGPAVVPGNPDESLLIQAVKYEGLEMPPQKRLSDEEIETLSRWIEDGAAWPQEEVTIPIGKPNEEYERLRKTHWSWQPLTNPTPPEVQDTSWPRDTIDRFVLAQLEAQNLAPVADADKITLIRRVTFDLTGLPPTLEEIDDFLADSSPKAFEKVVDRLLASSAYGERWGRHWLDVARYGESTGSSRNVPYPQAWRYRDYVINAFNNDKPYDQFIREQIAGDLLPAENEQQREEQLVATGFLALGVKDVNQRFKVRFIMDNIDEQIDTVTRSILGLTVSCARCHDHKFDPVPTSDYYALAGIFHSTELCAGVRNKMGGSGLDYYDTSMLIVLQASNGPDEDLQKRIEKLKVEVAEAKAKFEALRDSPEGAEPAPNGRPKRQVARNRWNRLQQELNALTDPAASGNVILGVREAKTIGDTEIRIRGEAERLGPVVPRGFLSLIDVPDVPPISAAQSGRLELAQWLTSPKNPLTSRVIANRVWRNLFGRGLVTSVDNFGVTGDAPSHPELLDHLANRLIDNGWSIKSLVRPIVLSRTYQLDSTATPQHLAVDPENRWLWRHSPRRMDAEELRDAMLVASGNLNPSRAEGSPAQKLKVMEIRNNGPEAKEIAAAAQASMHRSVYLPLLRGLTPAALEIFDFAEQGMVTGKRDTTTVAPQALYLLNNSFVRRQALTLAERLLARSDLDTEQRLQLAYRRTLGRTASTAEIERAKNFLAEYALAAQEQFVTLVAQADSPQTQAEPTEPAESDVQATPVLDPDQVVLPDVPVAEEVVQPQSAEAAAWASFCQALMGSAEFRYLR